MTIKNDDNNDTVIAEEEPETEGDNVSVLIPTLDFFAQVPPDLFPPLLPQVNYESKAEGEFEETTEDKYSDLYQRLMASTARSTALANRLAEMHQNRTSLEGGEESDYEPRTEEDSIVANSPDIISEIASEVAEVEGDYVDEDEDEEGMENRTMNP